MLRTVWHFSSLFLAKIVEIIIMIIEILFHYNCMQIFLILPSLAVSTKNKIEFCSDRILQNAIYQFIVFAYVSFTIPSFLRLFN